MTVRRIPEQPSPVGDLLGRAHVMWPRGSTQAQLATIDDRLDNIETALTEARRYPHEHALVLELEDRLSELRADRARVAAMIPQQRRAES